MRSLKCLCIFAGHVCLLEATSLKFTNWYPVYFSPQFNVSSVAATTLLSRLLVTFRTQVKLPSIELSMMSVKRRSLYNRQNEIMMVANNATGHHSIML